jgi:tRNA A-37 threonylcarbamoyl transferase component Bud32
MLHGDLSIREVSLFLMDLYFVDFGLNSFIFVTGITIINTHTFICQNKSVELDWSC